MSTNVLRAWSTCTAYRSLEGVKVDTVHYASKRECERAYARACNLNGPVIEVIMYDLDNRHVRTWNRNREKNRAPF